jgi:hypothetical protein
MGEHRREVGIVELVVDDEAGIDRDRRAVIVDGDGMAVASGAQLAVIDPDRIALRKCPGRGIAGNSRSDNRDAHL